MRVIPKGRYHRRAEDSLHVTLYTHVQMTLCTLLGGLGECALPPRAVTLDVHRTLCTFSLHPRAEYPEHVQIFGRERAEDPLHVTGWHRRALGIPKSLPTIQLNRMPNGDFSVI